MNAYRAVMDLSRITLVAPGWLDVGVEDASDTRVLVRVEPRDGRAAIAAMILVGGHLDAAAMRSISPARIEAGLNLHGPIGGGAPGATLTPEQLEEFAAQGVLYPAEFRALDDALAACVAAADAAPRKRARRKRRTPLTRPDGKDPAAFYRRVAEAYVEAASTDSAPAPAMAAEAGVPVATVRGWISEARRRGALPPAPPRGRAG